MLEEVSERIKEGWDVNQQNTSGKTPLDNAENEEVKVLLREHGGKHTLFHAVQSCMLEEVSELIRAGADVNQQNASSKTPLDYAENEEVKALLREHGGRHSLFQALEKRMLEDAAELIKQGADVNQLGGEEDGSPLLVTPLLFATFTGNESMVALLLASKADVNPAHKFGTPLEVAQGDDMKEIVDLLKAHGACEGAQSSTAKFPTLQDRLALLEYRCFG